MNAEVDAVALFEGFDRGESKADLSRKFGVSERTVQRVVEVFLRGCVHGRKRQLMDLGLCPICWNPDEFGRRLATAPTRRKCEYSRSPKDPAA